MSLLVALDVQHIGKPSGSRPWLDRGAVSPAGWTEVDLTLAYTIAAERELQRLGHHVVLLTDGTYRERWARADRYGADIYVACHADAGGGDRGTVYHDYRSVGAEPTERGFGLAWAVARALADVVPWPIAAAPLSPGVRGWVCISGVQAVALLLEPGYVDGLALHEGRPHHRILWDRADAIGAALTRGIDEWARART